MPDATTSMEPLSQHLSDGTTGYRVANALSYVINPLVLPPLGFGLVAAHFGAAPREIVTLTSITLIFFFLVPLAYITWLVRTGAVASLEVRERGKRTKPLLVGVGSYLIGVLLIALLGETMVPLLVALALVLPVNTLLTLVITLRWKISIHLIGLAGFLAGLLFVAVTPWSDGVADPLLTGRRLAPALALLPLLMWARVRAHAHSRAQVTAGAVFGFAATWLELTLFAQFYGLV